ncbi:hypothetical protein FOA52_004391 [Chlamydomonas sp. UWO 241]|nr:hypothetical protein FOA52_004391 [Chlamydomonas sp. UWO 241]
MAERAVLDMLQSNNKPFSVQNLVDLLAHQGHKKAAITKALESLSSSGKVVTKDFGKTKIFIPVQSDLPVLSKEEMDSKRAALKALQLEMGEERSGLKALESELSSWQSALTEAQLEVAVEKLGGELQEKQGRLERLKSGATLVSQKDRDGAVKKLSEAAEAWRKRKAAFRSIWDGISEGLDGKEADLFEEMGVEKDEEVGADLKAVQAMLAPSGGGGGGVKRPRTVLTPRPAN